MLWSRLSVGATCAIAFAAAAAAQPRAEAPGRGGDVTAALRSVEARIGAAAEAVFPEPVPRVDAKQSGVGPARATEESEQGAIRSLPPTPADAAHVETLDEAEIAIERLEAEAAALDAPRWLGADPDAELAERHLREGRARYASGSWATAAIHLELAVEVGGTAIEDYPLALFQLGEALANQRLWSSALPYYRRVLSIPGAPQASDALVRAMDCELRLGHPEKVVELRSWALRTWRDAKLPPEALFLSAQGAYQRDDVHPEQRDREALELWKDVPAQYRVAATYYRGAIHVRAGRLPEAAKEFEECDRTTISLEQQRAADARVSAQRELCWLALGRVHGEASNLDEASFWYKLVPASSPHGVEAAYELAWTFSQAGLHERALAVADAARAATATPSPTGAKLELLRARMLLALGRHAEAEPAFEAVRRRYGAARAELDELLATAREPDSYVERLASAVNGETSATSMSWVARTKDVGGVVRALVAVDETGRALAVVRAAAEEVSGSMARVGDVELFSAFAATHARGRALQEAARAVDARLGAIESRGSTSPPSGESGASGDRGAELRARLQAILAAAERLTRAPAEAARARVTALRARLDAKVRSGVDAEAELVEVRRDTRRVATAIAFPAFQAARAELHRIVLAGDRGIADVALAKTEEVSARIQQLLFRRMVEDSLPATSWRRDAITADLARRGDLLAREQRARRDAAIAQLEAYVKSYPDDPAYTPRALSRLAELQYQRATEEQATGIARGTPGDGASTRRVAAEPRTCTATLALYDHLDASFPAYQKKDSLYLLLGYCLGEAGRTTDALRVLRQLVERYPDSAHVPEAWVRMGDLQFEDPARRSLDRAIEAYSNLRGRRDHPLYAHAQLMLASSWTRAGSPARALQALLAVLDHELPQGDERLSEEGVFGEALRAAAALLASPNWDGVEQARTEFVRAHGKPYETLVYRALGDALFDQGRYPIAVQAYKAALSADPLSPDAPRVHGKIITAWAREKRTAAEASEREAFLAAYRPGTPWWERNGRDAAPKDVADLRAAALTEAAADHHRQAKELARTGKGDAAREAYRRAERDYAEYLEAAPGAKDADEAAYARAECAYHAGDLEQAARLYERIRDGSSARASDAGLGAVLSRSADAEQRVASGKLARREVVLAKERRGPVAAEPMPEPFAAVVRATDAFVARFAQHDRAPVLAYQAAELFYRYDQFPEARRRFDDIVARWPKSPAAQYAANLTIETHLAAKDWAAVESASVLLKEKVAERNPELAGAMERTAMGGRFQRALDLMNARRWDEAAALFVTVADEAPRGEFAAKALYNAALCNESAGRARGATPLYERLVADHSTSPEAEEALLRAAGAARATYDFDRAAERYAAFVAQYPRSKRRAEALLDLAEALEAAGRGAAAAATLEHPALAVGDAAVVARTQLRAARLYGDAGKWKEAAGALDALDRKLRASADADTAVQALALLGRARRQVGDAAGAARADAAAVAEFARRRIDPAQHPGAADAAAGAQFELAEVELARFEALTIPATTSVKKLESALRAKIAKLEEVGSRYDAVKRYRVATWVVAASYRQGYALDRMSQELLAAPAPPELRQAGQETALAAYQDQLAAFATPYERRAAQLYADAMAIARERHVVSDWTRDLADALARLRPKEYPRVRIVKMHLTADPGLEKTARTPEAEREARSAVAREPRDPASLVALATSFQARGRLDAAALVLVDAREVASRDAAYWNRLAWVEYARGRPPRALECWRKVVELRPTDLDARVNAAYLLTAGGDAAAAVALLEPAVTRDTRNAVAWLGLGNAYRAANRRDDAERAYEMASSLDPALTDASCNLGVLSLEKQSAAPEVGGLQAALARLDGCATAGGADPVIAQYRKEANALLERARKRAERSP